VRARDERGHDGVGAGLRRRARVASDERDAIALDAGDRGADVRAAEIEAQV